MSAKFSTNPKLVKLSQRTARHKSRYACLVRGWSWRTTPERLQKAERLAERLGISKTELMERAIDLFIEHNRT